MRAPAPVPALVTFHLWRVPPRQLTTAVAHVALDRVALWATPGLRFAKTLGTGSGRTFRARDADPLRWGLLATWASPQDAARFETGRLVRSWDRVAGERWRAELLPLASRGRWARREPFGRPTPTRTERPVAAVTRARLTPRAMRTFWGAVPPVSATLQEAPGLRLAVGIGEAPVGLQGTFSVWDSTRALVDFARGAAHADVVRRTPQERWYAEELFARFAVVGAEGTVDGRDPLAGARPALTAVRRARDVPPSSTPRPALREDTVVGRGPGGKDQSSRVLRMARPHRPPGRPALGPVGPGVTSPPPAPHPPGA